jgi:probable selenium-dependent hydroxylase accessory protein YqeC
MTNDDKRTLTAQGGQPFYYELAHASQPPLQPASLADALGVRHGITAIIGSGGKTSLLRSLSRELSHELPSEVSREMSHELPSKVSREMPCEMPCEQARQLSHESSRGRSGRGSRILLTTTTHILPFQDLPCLRVSSEATSSWVREQLAGFDVSVKEICFGSGLLPENSDSRLSFNPKLSAPGFPLYELLPVADYILTEADGARHHYMKAHAHYEPVIPDRCGRTILVIGAQGFGMKVAEAVHRPEIFCRLTGTQPGDIVTPALYAEFLRREVEGGLAFDCILMNGVSCEHRRDCAAEFAAEFTVKMAGQFSGPVVLAALPLA